MEKIKAVGYIRVSTIEQVNEGISLDAQRASIKNYCQFKNYELDFIYEDPGVSTKYPLEQRAGGSRLLESLQRKQATHIIACKLDRLFRDTIECLETIKSWDKKQITLHLIDMGGQTLDTKSAMGRFFITLLASVAEFERNQIRDRVKFTLAHKKSQGKRISGELPYGFTLDTDGETLIEDTQEQDNINFMLSLRESKMSLRKITAALNKSDRLPRGKKWHLTSIAEIIKREHGRNR
jgi:DNA invertase Pin-like site-specific DNA recombinase